MRAPRLFAAFIVATLLATGGLIWGDPGKTPESFHAAPVVTSSTTTTEPDFSALVASGVVTTPFAEEEEELVEEALSRVDSTTSTSTTTSLVTTTTEASSSTPTSRPTTTTTAPSSEPSGGYNSGAEGDFAGRINSHRSASGLPALARSGDLDSHARSWAKQMAQNGSLGHSNIGSLLGPWSAVAENVGVGGSVSSIFSALVSSGSHNSNMLGDYTHMGIGVWEDADGTLWTAHVFAR